MNIKKAFYRCASPLKYVGVIYEKALTLRKILWREFNNKAENESIGWWQVY